MPWCVMTDSDVYACGLEVGNRSDLPDYVVSAAAIKSFAQQWDPLDLHTDETKASRGRFGGLIASGIHTLGIFQRLAVMHHLHSWRIIAGRGVRDLNFPRPVRPGDTLSGWFEVSSIEPGARAGDVVAIAGFLHNQTGEAVLTLTMELSVEHAP